MRIAFLTNDNREIQRCYDEAEPRFGPAPSALLEGFERLGSEVEVHVVSCTQRPLRAPEKIAENIGYHSVLVPKWGWLKTGYSGCIRAVRRKLREIQPDMVHGQGTERDCSMCAAFSGFPNLVTIHGNMREIARKLGAPPMSFNWLTARIEGVTLRRTGGVVCLSTYTRRQVGDLCPRTWILPNPFPARYEAEPEPLPARTRILLPANLISYKNQLDYIRALDELAAVHDFELILAGKAGVDEFSQAVLQAVEERPWVSYLGSLDAARLQEEYGQASMVALPTREDNCPMVVLEAMASGRPLVAGRVGGVPDLVDEGVNGFLCDPHSPESMRESTRKLVADAGLREAMGTRARERALERYRPEVIARKHLDIYREMLKGRGRRAES